MGPRLGRFDEYGQVNEVGFEHASLQNMVQGLLFLWFGWYGFNAGSAFNYGGPAFPYLLLAGHVCITTTLEEVMDYRTYCETMAGLLQKPIVKLLRNLKVSRNVKWIYQEGISISGRCSLACFNGKLQ